MALTEALATIDYRLSTIDYEEVPTMDQTKSCPLLLAAALTALGAGAGRVTVSPEAPKCQGPACAWWDARAERCALLTLARRA